ncbi:MAG: cation:proton antiporter [Patescibacteria group bacterium]
MILEELFVQIGLIFVVASFLAFIAARLKQPPIIAYIIAGILVGPRLAQLGSAEFFKTLSEIGIAFLLFTVGLNLNWRNIREIGWVALGTGIGQVAFTSGVAYYVGVALGLDQVTSAYVAVAIAFSSTIVVVKLLSDKDDLSTLYGKIAVGFLIVQDLLAILFLLLISATRSGGDVTTLLTVAVGKWIVVIVLLLIASNWILPRLTRMAARSQELLFLFGVAWCFGVASFLAMVGFGFELGALLAGISLSGVPYSQEIASRLRPLRDFFLIIFFILLGTQLSLDIVYTQAVLVIALSLFVIVVEPLIMLIILRALGYHPHTGFMVGTTVSQVSEFSFILLGAGVASGHIGQEAVTLVTLVALITIGSSSYFITHNDAIYRFFRPVLRLLEPKQARHEGEIKKRKSFSVLLIGCDRMGNVLLPKLKALHEPYLVVDFNPHVHETLEQRRIPHVYGDASDHEFLEDIRAQQAKLIISTVPNDELNTALLAHLRFKRYRGTVIVTVPAAEQAVHAYHLGATFVIVPSVLSGERFWDFLKKERLDRGRWQKLAKRVGG